MKKETPKPEDDHMCSCGPHKVYADSPPQPSQWEEYVERVEVLINRHSPMENFEIKEKCAREIVDYFRALLEKTRDEAARAIGQAASAAGIPIVDLDSKEDWERVRAQLEKSHGGLKCIPVKDCEQEIYRNVEGAKKDARQALLAELLEWLNRQKVPKEMHEYTQIGYSVALDTVFQELTKKHDETLE